jgi:hypothetical protein
MAARELAPRLQRRPRRRLAWRVLLSWRCSAPPPPRPRCRTAAPTTLTMPLPERDTPTIQTQPTTHERAGKVGASARWCCACKPLPCGGGGNGRIPAAATSSCGTVSMVSKSWHAQACHHRRSISVPPLKTAHTNEAEADGTDRNVGESQSLLRLLSCEAEADGTNRNVGESQSLLRFSACNDVRSRRRAPGASADPAPAAAAAASAAASASRPRGKSTRRRTDNELRGFSCVGAVEQRAVRTAPNGAVPENGRLCVVERGRWGASARPK